MRTFTLRHELNCDESTYWEKVAFSEDFNRWLYLDRLKLPAFRTLETRDDGQKLVRRAYIEPSIDQLPAAVQKMMGDKVAYTEEGEFDRARRVYKFRSVPHAMAEKVSITGEQSCLSAGEGKIVRETRMQVDVKVFGIGKLIEERICADSTATLNASAAYTNEYLKEHSP